MGGKIWTALFSHVPRSCLPLLNFHVLCVYSLKYTIGKDYMGIYGLGLCVACLCSYSYTG